MRWTTVWADDFDGPAGAPVDGATWSFETGGHGRGNAELQTYTDSEDNACLDGDGHLAITAHRTGDGGYTSARLVTRGAVGAGVARVEARLRLPRGRGLWPAFWLLGSDADEVGWPACGEVDVMEHLGHEPRTVHQTVHGPGYAGPDGLSAAWTSAVPLAEDTHLFAVEREAERIRWFVDGRCTRTLSRVELGDRPWVFDGEFHLLVNLAVGGRWPGPPDADAVFPQRLLVDRVAVLAPLDLARYWPARLPADLRTRLEAAYAAPGRGYHDLTHLQEVLQHVDELAGPDESVREAALLAGWFHDAVYDGRADDEERSARLAETELRGPLGPEAAREVARLVRLTADHRPGGADVAGQVLCDADLAILAAPPARYASYVRGVRSEYADVSDAAFAAGRAAVLRGLLAKPTLFHTRAARERWERRARLNVERELARPLH